MKSNIILATILGSALAINTGKWTEMDSAIRSAEADIFKGGAPYDRSSTKLSGYND